jgi:hypothetical protein
MCFIKIENLATLIRVQLANPTIKLSKIIKEHILSQEYFYPGLEVIDDLLHPAEKKLIFVSVWFSFSFALYLLNRLVLFQFQGF